MTVSSRPPASRSMELEAQVICPARTPSASHTKVSSGGLTEQMEIVVLVAAGLVDVPKGLPHQRLHSAAVGGGLVAKSQ